MSFWDDFTKSFGMSGDYATNPFTGPGGLWSSEPDYNPIVTAGHPVAPSVDVTDAEQKAWNLQNANAFANYGIGTTPQGEQFKLTKYDPWKAVGAISPDGGNDSLIPDSLRSAVGSVTPSFQLPDFSKLLTELAIGAGILIALVVVLNVVKK